MTLPTPPPGLSALTYQVLSEEPISQRQGQGGARGTATQGGKKETEREDSESLARAKERVETDPGILACGKGQTLRPESTAKAGILEERGKRVEHEQGREGEVTGGGVHILFCALLQARCR